MTFPAAGSSRAGDRRVTVALRQGLVVFDERFDAATLHLLRERVAACAAVAGVPEDRAVDVILAVHELAANAVTHGAGSGQAADARDGRRAAAARSAMPARARGPGRCGRGTACGSCGRSPTRLPRLPARTGPRSPLCSDGRPGRAVATWVHKRPDPVQARRTCPVVSLANHEVT